MQYSLEQPSIASASYRTLAELLGEIKDQRKARGLILILLAKLCGANKPAEIADWITERAQRLKEALCLSWKKMPHESTYRRLLHSFIEVEQLEEKARLYLCQQASPKPETTIDEVLAMDGKTLRGTIAEGETQGAQLL